MSREEASLKVSSFLPTEKNEEVIMFDCIFYLHFLLFILTDYTVNNCGGIWTFILSFARIHYCGYNIVKKSGYDERIPWMSRKYSNFDNLIMYVTGFSVN